MASERNRPGGHDNSRNHRRFPQSRDQFDGDDRIAFDKASEAWILEDYDGSQWEFSEHYQKWISMVDEADIERHQSGYVYRGDDAKAAVPPASKKRKTSDDKADNEGDANQMKRTKNGGKDPQGPAKSAIYLKNLPLDTDEEELAAFCSRAGLLEEDLDTAAPRVKLYRDKDGELKGDAVVHYHKSNSVPLALDILDGRPYRANQPFEHSIEVTEADFAAYKKEKKPKPPAEPEVEAPNQAEKNQANRKKALQKSKTKLNSMLTDWGDDEMSAIVQEDMQDAKFVVLTHMFTLGEVQETPKIVKAIESQTARRCRQYGDVVKVVAFDQESEGIVRVRFQTAEAAQACIAALHGKLKYGLPGAEVSVEAYISDGMEGFKKARGPAVAAKANGDEPIVG